MTRRQAGIAHASAGSAGRVQSRPCPPPPPRLPPPRSPPPRSGRSPPRSSCRCGGAGRWPAARWPAARGALPSAGRAAVRCAWAAPDCRDRVPAAACGAAGPVREPAAAPGPAGEEAAPRGPAAARRARSGAGRGRRGSGPDAARCWCCASRNRCGDRLAGRRRDSVRHRAGSRRPARAVLHEGARRAALVVLEELPAIGAGRAREVALRGGGRDVGFVARGGLARVGHAPDAVRTAVVADAAVVDVVDHYVVRIHVGDMRDVHIGHRAVVEVAVVVPVAAHETDADITEAVVDAAVEADVRPQ